MADSRNFYAILGVSTEATQDDIKAAYITLAVKYHPDKNLNTKDNPDAQDIAAEQFKDVNNAYETLKDVEKRREYNLKLPKITSGKSSYQYKPTPSSDYQSPKKEF